MGKEYKKIFLERSESQEKLLRINETKLKQLLPEQDSGKVAGPSWVDLERSKRT